MSFIKLDLEDIRNNKNFDEVITILEEGIDNHLEWEGKTRAELVKIAAEKLLEAGYPPLEIKELIVERLNGKIREHYVRQCLDERFKKATLVASAKKSAEARKQQQQQQQQMVGATGSTTYTAMEPPEHESDGDDPEYEGDDTAIPSTDRQPREQLPDIRPQLESESEQEEEPNNTKRYSEEYVSSLEEQVKALNGDLPYKDCLALLRLVKIDKVTENRILNASRASKTHVYLYIDIRSNEVREIYTDTEYLKKIKLEQKSKQEAQL